MLQAGGGGEPRDRSTTNTPRGWVKQQASNTHTYKYSRTPWNRQQHIKYSKVGYGKWHQNVKHLPLPAGAEYHLSLIARSRLYIHVYLKYRPAGAFNGATTAVRA